MRRRSARRSGLIAGLVAVAAFGGMTVGMPALAAIACPPCYGMEHIASALIVDRDMSPEQRDRLGAAIESSKANVTKFFGSFVLDPIIVACSNDACDRRMGGKGARAVTVDTPFVTFLRVSPRGLDETILTHEFTHVETHRRIGFWKLVAGAMPAWFDEGLAVLVSNDARYLREGATARAHCIGNPDADLPSTTWDWAPRAGREPTLYADAACRTALWIEAHGGDAGAVAAIDSIGAGEPAPF